MYNYTEQDIWRFLYNYQVHVQYAKTPRREDVLTQKLSPADEGSFVAGAIQLADIETAIMQQGSDGWLLFMIGALKGSSWCRRSHERSWRQQVGDWWGLTPSEVKKRSEEAVQRVLNYLNGHSVVFNSPVEVRERQAVATR